MINRPALLPPILPLIFAVLSSLSSTASSQDEIFDPEGAADQTSPRIGIDEEGTFCAPWRDYRNNTPIHLAYRPVGGSWEPSTSVDPSSTSYQVHPARGPRDPAEGVTDTRGSAQTTNIDLDEAPQTSTTWDEMQAEKNQGEKPPLNGGRIIGEFLAGGVGGIVGSIILGLAGFSLTYDSDNETYFGGLEIGGLLGSVIGSSLGIHIVGERGNETGSYMAALLGSTVGAAAFLAISSNFEADLDDPLFCIGVYAMPTIGGLIGFNITRGYETSSDFNAALIDFRDGRICLAIPMISFCPNASDKSDLIQNINLVRVRF